MNGTRFICQILISLFILFETLAVFALFIYLLHMVQTSGYLLLFIARGTSCQDVGLYIAFYQNQFAGESDLMKKIFPLRTCDLL